MLGIGAQHTKDPNGIAWKQNQDFENLLKRLNSNSEDPTEDGVDPTPVAGFQRASVHEPIPGAVKTGPETEGKDEDGKVKEKKKKKKKRPRDDCETTKMEESQLGKRKRVESTTVTPCSELLEEGPSNSNHPSPETVPFVIIYYSLKNATPDPWAPALLGKPIEEVVLTDPGSSLPNVSSKLHP